MTTVILLIGCFQEDDARARRLFNFVMASLVSTKILIGCGSCTNVGEEPEIMAS